MLKARLTKVNVLNVKKTKNIRKFASKPAAKKEDKVELKNATVPQQQQQTENFDVNSEIFGKIARGVQGVEIPSNLKKGIQTPKQLGLLLQSFATHGPNHLFQNNNIVQGPVRVAVTGAAGQIGYSLLPRIASGEMLGENQPVILHLIERPEAMEQLKGVVMELQDCAFPNLHGIVATSSLEEGFGDVDYAILVGAKPRGPGMERGDLLKDNAKIFTAQGSAIGNFAKSDALVLVVGNPANTNALIAASKASKRIPRENFSALTRLDHDRALAQIAIKTGCKLDDIERFAIWGNHSATQYPDLSFTTIDGKWAKSIINDEEWIRSNFIPTVQKRGAAIIAARGASSAQSAADASIKHMRDWVFGAPGWLSMAVPSDGSYGIPEGVFCSYPVQCFGQGKYGIIGNLPIDEFSAKMINQSVDELFSERDAVKELIQ